MLERVKPGDLVILSNGDQARVIRVERMPTGNYDLYFDKPLPGCIGGSKYEHWVYRRNGTLSNLTGDEYLYIVKLIAG